VIEEGDEALLNPDPILYVNLKGNLARMERIIEGIDSALG
jgi:hypothetical protein